MLSCDNVVTPQERQTMERQETTQYWWIVPGSNSNIGSENEKNQLKEAAIGIFQHYLLSRRRPFRDRSSKGFFSISRELYQSKPGHYSSSCQLHSYMASTGTILVGGKMSIMRSSMGDSLKSVLAAGGLVNSVVNNLYKFVFFSFWHLMNATPWMLFNILVVSRIQKEKSKLCNGLYICK